MWTRLSAIALHAVLVSVWVGAPTHAETIKVGVINTYSGPNASLGDQIDKGISL